MAPTARRARFLRTDALRTPTAAFVVLALLALPASSLLAQDDAAQASEPARSWRQKVSLQFVDLPPSATPPPLCELRFVEGGFELSIVCDHRLGSTGELSLVRVGTESPLWFAPLDSPFEAVAALSDDALATLLAGELALRIEAAGGVAESAIGVPIFDSGFDDFSLCEWSNFPCPSDANICTTETCSSTGVCTHPPNTLPCDLPGASGGCFLGGCIIVSCDAGYSHCDTSNINGCEVNHNNGPGTCSQNVNFVGSYTGDTVCGPGGCFLNMAANTFATRTGRGEAYYSAEVLEGSICDASIEHSIELIVPPGVDYDLYVYRDCILVGSSKATTGLDEYLRIEQEDLNVGSDAFTYQVEVRWYSGRSCEDWTLKFIGLTC